MLRYALTGGLAAAVDIGSFAALMALLVRSGHAPVWAAASLSFLLAAAVNYRASAHWVFDREWRSGARALRFLVGASLGLAVNAGTTSALALLARWPPLAAKVAGVGLAFGLNFAVNARWVFGPGAKENGPATRPPSGARSQAR